MPASAEDDLDLPLAPRLVLDRRHTKSARRLVDRLAAIALVPSNPVADAFENVARRLLPHQLAVGVALPVIGQTLDRGCGDVRLGHKCGPPQRHDLAPASETVDRSRSADSFRGRPPERVEAYPGELPQRRSHTDEDLDLQRAGNPPLRPHRPVRFPRKVVGSLKITRFAGRPINLMKLSPLKRLNRLLAKP
jgi:hypothetical protein